MHRDFCDVQGSGEGTRVSPWWAEAQPWDSTHCPRGAQGCWRPGPGSVHSGLETEAPCERGALRPKEVKHER